MSTTPSDWIELRSDTLSASIDPQGAQLSLLRDSNEQDLLWNGDPAVWKGRAPVLFPIVGELNGGQYRWQSRQYALGRHGFARDRRFELVRKGGSEALFRLADDEQSREVYPFAFEFDVLFQLAGSQLTVIASVRNKGEAPLPASIGFHPAFRWPLSPGAARDQHFLEFAQQEAAPIRRLDSRGLLIAEPRETPVNGRRLMLDDALFKDDVVVFDRLASRSVAYSDSRNGILRVDFPDATHLGIWTKPGAGFICIEPWRGVADPQGFEGELSDKPGVFMVPSGGSESLTMRMEWRAG